MHFEEDIIGLKEIIILNLEKIHLEFRINK